jgi:hypothetical protein
MSTPGFYIYWLGETLNFNAVGLEQLGPIEGSLEMFSKIGVEENRGFSLTKREVPVADSHVVKTTIYFSAKQDAQLTLAPPRVAAPSEFSIKSGFPLSSVFVGQQRISPRINVFSAHVQDRHGHAWADVNADGQTDVYISRGGVGGTLRKLPRELRDTIRDEFLVSGREPRLKDVTAMAGFEKKDCSGRHAEWVDVDGDGRLELFVNCQDRGVIQGRFPKRFPKQLWRQDANGRFNDKAMEIGLGLPGHEIIDFIWLDADTDGDLDLLASEDKGFFLHRNDAGRFTPEFLFRPDFVRADVVGLRTRVNNYWRFDGKITAADFDGDGDLDVFSSSKRGNVILENQGGTFRSLNPADLGLPASSLNAAWVDYDNDGAMDLYSVPQGLYKQTDGGHFQRTDLLAVEPRLYQAAIIHWYDRDNDGKRDLLLALNENPTLWRWWQRPFRTDDDAHAWIFRSWRNAAPDQHWLQIEVAGPSGNRQAIGASVSVTTARGAQHQTVGINESSFFSQGHYRLYFGLGDATSAEKVAIRWTDGNTLTLENVPGDQLLHVTPNSGSVGTHN